MRGSLPLGGVMEIQNTYPPNFELIQSILPTSKERPAIFCYGNTIHNPYGLDVKPELIFHEQIHANQQGKKPDEWWTHYLTDTQFRLRQEVEAYGAQYYFVQKYLDQESTKAAEDGKIINRNKLLKHSLDSMAEALSGSIYGSLVEKHRAESLIRNYAKNYSVSKV